jgi:hypothetical protein
MLRLWFSMEARELFLSQMKIVSYTDMFGQLPKRYQTGLRNPSKQLEFVRPSPAKPGKCQKGSKWSTSRVRPRRNVLRRFSVSATEKPQMTKRYRTL